MRITAPVLALFACSFLARPQAPNAGIDPAFEAASVRLDFANQNPEPIQSTPGSLTIRGQSLQACIQWAYRMPRVQISGPGWLNDVRLDILAKAADPADEARLRMMLRTLLADRMGLEVSCRTERKCRFTP